LIDGTPAVTVMRLQSMKLDEACVEALRILKQVMEEKLTSTNIEARSRFACTA